MKAAACRVRESRLLETARRRSAGSCSGPSWRTVTSAARRTGCGLDVDARPAGDPAGSRFASGGPRDERRRGKKPDPRPDPRRCADGERTETAAAEHARIERAVQPGASLTRDACLELFTDRLKHYQVAVHLCSRREIAATIAQEMAARGKSRLIVPADIDPAWLPHGVAFMRDDGLTYRELDVSEGVLTGCSLGIATTGTIVLRQGPARAPRADAHPRLSPLRRASRADRRDRARSRSGARGSEARAGHDDLRPFRDGRHRDDADPRCTRAANAGRHRCRRARQLLTSSVPQGAALWGERRPRRQCLL